MAVGYKGQKLKTVPVAFEINWMRRKPLPELFKPKVKTRSRLCVFL